MKNSSQKSQNNSNLKQMTLTFSKTSNLTSNGETKVLTKRKYEFTTVETPTSKKRKSSSSETLMESTILKTSTKNKNSKEEQIEGNNENDDGIVLFPFHEANTFYCRKTKKYKSKWDLIVEALTTAKISNSQELQVMHFLYL